MHRVPWGEFQQPAQRLLMALVRGYRFFLKPWLGNACRFEPTCSQYALQALEQHGAIKGAALTTGRLLRCHPWCAGGCDPVPPGRLFSCAPKSELPPDLPPDLPPESRSERNLTP